NVTSVMPNRMMTTCTRRRGSDPNRLTSYLPLPGPLVRTHGQRLQGQVVVAERGGVEAVHPVAHPVAVRAVVHHHERRLLVDGLLDLVVELLAGGAVQLAAGLVDGVDGRGVTPGAAE